MEQRSHCIDSMLDAWIQKVKTARVGGTFSFDCSRNWRDPDLPGLCSNDHLTPALHVAAFFADLTYMMIQSITACTYMQIYFCSSSS